MIMDYFKLLVGEGGVIGSIGTIITAIFTILGYKIKKGEASSDNKGEKEISKKEHQFSSFLSRHRRKLLVVCVICVIFTAVNIFVNSMNLFPELPVKYSYAVKDDKTLCITGLPDDSVTNLEIPEKILGKTVTEIGDRAFADCTSITSVTIPASVKLIGTNAFLNCTSLTHINVVDDNEHYSSAEGILFNKTKTKLVCYPDGKNIGEVVKSGTCGESHSMTWDLYESGVLIISGFGWMKDFTDDVTKNPWHDNCSDIKSVVFDGSITSIGGRAFQDCSNLKSIVIPNSICQIGVAAFEYCSSLTSVTVPDSVTVIDGSTFFGCSSLTDVTLPDSITTIGGTAFYYCSSLSNIVIPESVTQIGKFAFYGCSSLTDVTFPSSLTSIGEGAFSRCSSLSNVELPNSIAYISPFAFKYCNSLKSIAIPISVVKIDYDVFNNCINLTDVYYEGSEEDWKKISIGKNNDCLTQATIHYNSQANTTAAD